jgi:hypothetical protein
MRRRGLALLLTVCGAVLAFIGIRGSRPSGTRPALPLPRNASAPGVGLAYDVAVQKLAHQFANIDRLNTQLALVLGALIAVATLIFIAAESALGRVTTGILLFISLVQTARASRLTTFHDAPRPREFAAYAGDNPGFMKEVALPEVLEALDHNRPIITRKEDRLDQGTLFLGLAVIVIFVDRFVPDAITLSRQIGELVRHFIH